MAIGPGRRDRQVSLRPVYGEWAISFVTEQTQRQPSRREALLSGARASGIPGTKRKEGDVPKRTRARALARPAGPDRPLLILDRFKEKNLHLLPRPFGWQVDVSAVPVLCHLLIGHPIRIDPDLENFATHYYHIRSPYG